MNEESCGRAALGVFLGVSQKVLDDLSVHTGFCSLILGGLCPWPMNCTLCVTRGVLNMRRGLLDSITMVRIHSYNVGCSANTHYTGMLLEVIIPPFNHKQCREQLS
jgi:hypothetical protein